MQGRCKMDKSFLILRSLRFLPHTNEGDKKVAVSFNAHMKFVPDIHWYFPFCYLRNTTKTAETIFSSLEETFKHHNDGSIICLDVVRWYRKKQGETL